MPGAQCCCTGLSAEAAGYYEESIPLGELQWKARRQHALCRADVGCVGFSVPASDQHARPGHPRLFQCQQLMHAVRCTHAVLAVLRHMCALHSAFQCVLHTGLSLPLSLSLSLCVCVGVWVFSRPTCCA